MGLLGHGSLRELELLRPECVIVHWQKLWDKEVSEQEQVWLQSPVLNGEVRAAGMCGSSWKMPVSLLGHVGSGR